MNQTFSEIIQGYNVGDFSMGSIGPEKLRSVVEVSVINSGYDRDACFSVVDLDGVWSDVKSSAVVIT